VVHPTRNELAVTAADTARSRARFAIESSAFAPLIVAVAYAVGSLAGLSLQFPHTQISVFWPPNAILLAALLVTPRSRWWVHVAAVLPAHLLVQLAMGIALPAAFVNFAGNSADALLAAFAIDLVVPAPRRFDQVRTVTLLIVCGGLLAPAISSLAVSAVFTEMGLTADLWTSWRLRVLTNALAVITLVPPIVLGITGYGFQKERPWRGRPGEAALLITALAALSLVVFELPEAGPGSSPVLLYLPFPLLLWAALRFGLTGASLSILLLGGLALTSAVRGLGPFVTADPVGNATSLVLYLLATGVPLLLLAAAMKERETVDAGRRRVEKLHGAVLDSLRDRIAVLDREGFIVEVNDAWSRAGLAGPGHDYFKHWQEEAGHLAFGSEQMEKGVRDVLLGARHRFQIELPSLAASGTWFGFSVDSLRQPEGGAVVTSTDITTRKQAELQARDQRGELAHLTRVATLGELSGAMAHELSQPLTAILSNAQAAQRLICRSEPDLVEIESILADIVDDDRRAGEVIDRLRAMLRKEELQFLPVDLNHVIAEVLALERSDLISRRVTVQLQLAEDLPPVRGDRVQLQQVLLNLMLNACEAMAALPPAARRVVVTTTRDGDASQVNVEDRGSGIPADALDRMFEPFFTTKKHGLGMGLSICRSIVEVHGGRLWVSNNEGPGATFHLSLPTTSSESARV